MPTQTNKVKIQARDPKYLPVKKTSKDAGYDLRVAIDTPIEDYAIKGGLADYLKRQKFYNAKETGFYVDGKFICLDLSQLNYSNSDLDFYVEDALLKIKEAATSPNFAIIGAGSTQLISSGLKFKMPSAAKGYNNALFLYPRSGLAAKCNLQLANSVGIVDETYIAEEVKMALYNASPFMHILSDCTRVAQAVFQRVLDVEFEEVSAENWDTTDDREGGFGSSGVA